MNDKKKIVKHKIVLFLTAGIVPLMVHLFLRYFPPIGHLPDKGKRKEYEKKTKYYYKGKFHNIEDFKMMTAKASKPDSRCVPDKRIKVSKITHIDRAEKDEMALYWLGHSSSLLQMGRANILIDPVFGMRTSPVSFIGPERFSDVPLDVENIPDIDVLFISHDHYDHLDYWTIRKVDDKVRKYIVPIGVDVILKGWGVDESKLLTLSWWESIELEDVRYTLIPSRHYTGRNPLHTFATLWGGIYVSNEYHTFYYTGDTGYCDIFKKVYESFGKTELMLADCGQYDKGWANTHMFPYQTVRAAQDAKAKCLIPVHWGAYRLSNHPWDEPPRAAKKAAEEMKVNIYVPRIGQRVSYR